MRIDLFEFVEGVIRGIVYFLYNLIETTAAILRHPVRGPLQLTRRYGNPRARQVGGLTYLFLVLVIAQWMVVSWNGSVSAQGVIESVTTTPTLDSEAMWPFLLAGLISTVVIDSVLRLILRWRLPQRHDLRQRLLSSAEFALLWIFVSLGLATLIATIVDDYLRLNANWVGVATQIGTLIGLIASAYPATAVLTGVVTRPRRRIRKRKLISLMTGIMLLVFLAIMIGYMIAEGIQEGRGRKAASRSLLTLETLRCTILADGRISADGLLYFDHGPAIAAESDDLMLMPDLMAWNDKDEWPVAWRQGDPHRLVVVEAGQPALVEVITRKPIALPADDTCKLGWRSNGPMNRRETASGVDLALGGHPSAVRLRPWTPAPEAGSK